MIISPLDWRSAVLAKHAQHVVLIHFPIALYLIAVGLDVLAQWLKRPQWTKTVYLNLTMAAAFTIPTLISGVAAWQWQLEGQRLKGLLLYHLGSSLLATVLIWMSWWIHWRRERSAEAVAPSLRMAIESIGVLVVGMTAHLGGFLSGVNT